MTTYPFNIFGGGWDRVTPTLEQLPYKGDTILGNDVWLGQHVTIMPGITIGDGAIVASNSTVVKDIEPYTIVGGNPAKTVKKRFDEETIALLLELKWWDQDEEWLDTHLERLVSTYDLEILRGLLNSK